MPIRPDPRSALAIKRVPATGAETRTIWFVDGGPGDAGRASLGKVAGVFAGDSGLAIYTFDHRGVGGSAPLECPEQRDPKSPDGAELTPKEWAPCVAHLKATRNDLQYIAVTQAARDLDLLVNRFRTPGAGTTVWGVSYGTFLTWEYLRVATTPPDAVIVDGIVPPDWSFAEFDAGLDKMGRRWIALCAADSTCALRTHGDPAGVVRAAADSLVSGPCKKTGLTPDIYRLVQGNLLMAGDPIRRLIPVMGYRVQRCLPRDRNAVVSLFKNLFESGEIGEDPNKAQSDRTATPRTLGALARQRPVSRSAPEGGRHRAAHDRGKRSVRENTAGLATRARCHVPRPAGLDRPAPHAAR
jgi:pimeloyl-ACP methyl ester carboxylesterase